jgi:hypothetical protein
MLLLDFGAKRVMFWENADQRMDFKNIDNTAEFTAAAALDSTAPRFLRFAGDQISAGELANVAGEMTKTKFELVRWAVWMSYLNLSNAIVPPIPRAKRARAHDGKPISTCTTCLAVAQDSNRSTTVSTRISSGYAHGS